ncbi:MAG: helix-turn-helix transcriptional regulator [Ruminococcaceae bacterium]|nr:helix-turn-helix transcriptional regulator [Oscillospiraceae bacterium]
MIQITGTKNKYESMNREDTTYRFELIDCVHYHPGDCIRCVHSYESHALFIVLSGTVQLGEFVCPEKKGVFVPKFTNLSVCINSEAEFVRIIFDSTIPFSFCSRQGFYVFGLTSEIRCFAERLIYLLSRPKIVPGAEEAVLLSILNELTLLRDAASPQMHLYDKVCLWIRENAHRPITAQETADAMNYSRAYLNRVLQATSGESLCEMITKTRMEEIKNLCHASDYSILEIAQKLGFLSAEHLCKFFKYHEGISISEYRASIF